MGRQLRTLVPTTTQQLKPNNIDLRKKDTQIKQRQKQTFDLRCTDLKPLKKGDEVCLPDRKEKGTIVKSQSTRSSVVKSESQGTYHNDATNAISETALCRHTKIRIRMTIAKRNAG